MLIPVTQPCYLTINQSEIVQELITYPVTYLQYLVFKKVLLKSFGDLGDFLGGLSHPLPFIALQESFLCFKLQLLHLFGLAVH